MGEVNDSCGAEEHDAMLYSIPLENKSTGMTTCELVRDSPFVFDDDSGIPLWLIHNFAAIIFARLLIYTVTFLIFLSLV